MAAIHLHLLVGHHLAPLHLVGCLHGELHLLLGQATTHQAFPWVGPLHHLHLEERVVLVLAAAAQHLPVGGVCLHGEQHHHLPQVEDLHQVQFHHLQGEEEHHHPCHIGIRVVEGGVVAKPTLFLIYSVLHHRPHHQAKQTLMLSLDKLKISSYSDAFYYAWNCTELLKMRD